MQAWDSPSSSTRRLNPIPASPAVSSGRSKKVSPKCDIEVSFPQQLELSVTTGAGLSLSGPPFKIETTVSGKKNNLKTSLILSRVN